MSKKILFCATVDYHFKAFHLPYMKWFQEQEWEVHVAASGDMELPYTDKKYDIPLQRSPFHIGNINAYKELKKVIDGNRYEIIHCHTPMGGVLARLAARNMRKKGTRVIYTAHGFHFYRGAPLQNWLLYYPVERGLTHYTDCLITINEEDYQLAQKKYKKQAHIKKIHGTGVNFSKFNPVSDHKKMELRKKHGFSETDFVLIYPAELNVNKNQQILIEMIEALKEKIPDIKLVLPGKGAMENWYKSFSIEKGVKEKVIFPGFREDIDELIKLSDVAVASSLREGLGINLIEAMACGKPIVAIDNRGHREVVQDGENGFLINQDSVGQFNQKVLELYASPKIRMEMGRSSLNIADKYSQANALKEMATIYTDYMN
ncbi:MULTISPECIES: glycosyltransferase family 4 protein [Bacillus cereus group]|uniref:glycosyltransferase family 4 protein n=1 Tax=Bacillus cereus group TaxID=86661 RepID=UPI0001A09B93|nr:MULTISPECIES: glycosyltransferase family 4 protein [Bacillus cereus group]EEL48458.1 Glycosyl transferase group 1 [Bacillus cereus Rock3-44]PFO80434.1 glycosyltransferase family 1 protein [Bacillus cereus]